MPRNKEDVRGRLRQAALELFGERGYDRTTAAEIAARAGVTERTFFRHFPDKREVLFEGEARLLAALGAAIAQAPDGMAPLEVLLAAFRSIEAMFMDNRPFAVPAQAVIAVTPALQERALGKAGTLIAAVALGLQQRGVEAKLAALAAQAGMAAVNHAFSAWAENPSLSLGTHLERSFAALYGLSATTRGS